MGSNREKKPWTNLQNSKIEAWRLRATTFANKNQNIIILKYVIFLYFKEKKMIRIQIWIVEAKTNIY